MDSPPAKMSPQEPARPLQLSPSSLQTPPLSPPGLPQALPPGMGHLYNPSSLPVSPQHAYRLAGASAPRTSVTLIELLPSEAWEYGPQSSGFVGQNLLDTQVKYMYCTVAHKAEALNERIERLGEAMRTQPETAGQLEDAEFESVVDYSGSTIVVCGRVCLEAALRERQMPNDTSFMLEGSRETSGGKRVPIDLGNCSKYTLFPGQIIACQAARISERLAIDAIFSSAPIPKPVFSEQYIRQCQAQRANGQPLSIWAAAGPFMNSNACDLNNEVTYNAGLFSPLFQLLYKVNAERPDVLILCGPFVDAQDQAVALNKFQVSFEQLLNFLHNTILACLRQIQQSSGTELPSTRVVIVPSVHDILHDCVFPQPPMVFDRLLPGASSEAKDLGIISYVPNPATFVIDELVVSVVNADLLEQMNRCSIHRDTGGLDRISSIFSQIIGQRSLFPLFPPVDQVPIDLTLQKHLLLPCTPSVVLTTTSKTAPMCREVDGVLFVNVRRLLYGSAENPTLGSVLQLTVHPSTEPVASRIRVDQIHL